MGELNAARFWSKVDKSGECWTWTGGRLRKGYGSFRPFREWPREQQAHRVSWVLVNGPVPIGMQVLHRCDNPPCVNPAHLFLGTNDDNVADKMAKRRQAYGERNPRCRLSASDVMSIRRQCAQGAARRDIAEKYGVSITHVGRIATGSRRADP